MWKQASGHGVILTRKAKRRYHTPVHVYHDVVAKTLSAQPRFVGFHYLFPDLIADEQNTLPRGTETIQALRALGTAMGQEETSQITTIPAGYTYFGQFIDHDITKQMVDPKIDSTDLDITRKDFLPLTVEQIQCSFINERTAPFDLDSLYARRVPRQGAMMQLGPNDQSSTDDPDRSALPVGKDPLNNDLPRAPISGGNRNFRPGQALIGDPRNDENLIISQLHVAFLKFHNMFVQKHGFNFRKAVKAVRQHYQAVVIFDFLKRIAEEAVVDGVLAGNQYFLPNTERGYFMPLEFSAAAFRFGHSMVRATYNFNVNFMPAKLADLFSFTALSGHLNPHAEPTRRFNSVPRNWIIQWENLLELAPTHIPEHTMLIDTALALPLAQLPKEEDMMAQLAQRNLLRGYLLNLPTGQSVARHIGGNAQVLTPDEILDAANPTDRQVLQDHPVLTRRTPLWYYTLIEAKHRHAGQRLGLVGSTIVAETIIGLIRQSKGSILRDTHWQPSLGEGFPTRREQLELRHIIEFAGLAPAMATEPQ